MDPTAEYWIELIGQCLTDDLRRKKYQGHPNKYRGHCYVVCEALYHLWAKDEGYVPHTVRINIRETHWFLKNKFSGEIIDPTYEQFDFDVASAYCEARGRGFLTKEPSKRAKILIDRITNSEE